jgi:hypothetical protein
MVSIFDYNITAQELKDIRFDSLSLCQKFGIEIDQPLTAKCLLRFSVII